MEFNLKKENRKKFQDKSKLKRHHKKDYSKVVPKVSENRDVDQQEQEVETEYEDVSEPELDEQGNFVLGEDEIEDYNEDGIKVVRRKKIDKVNSNAWRYREEVDVPGLDQDEEDFIKSIDFKKLDFNTIDSNKGKKQQSDYKKMSKDELGSLKIVDERFDNNRDDANSESQDLDELLNMTTPQPNPQQQQNQQPKQPHQNKTPSILKSDEAFLDDLL